MGNEQSSSSSSGGGGGGGQQNQPAKHIRNAGPTPSFRAFRDAYASLPDLQNDLRRAGLESSNLIVGIDATKSNEWEGRVSFGGRCLHHISPNPAEMNPYEQAISILGETLSAFDGEKRREKGEGER
jgi:E3 ubiquitin-protein ligase RGLG